MRGTHTPTYRDSSLLTGVRWDRVALPPTRERIIDRMERDATPERRHAEVTRAYYAPELVAPDEQHHADRELRVAARQVVVVAADGTVLSTWRDHRDRYGTAAPIPAPRTEVPVLGNAPATYDDLLAALAELGVPVSRHCWGDHWRVHTPDGLPDVYLPVDPVSGDDPASDADLLARLGVLVSQQDRR